MKNGILKTMTALTLALFVINTAFAALPCGDAKVKVIHKRYVKHKEETIIAHENNRFAFDLYRQLAEKEGNVFISPYSISTAMAMVYNGADGKTADEMADVMHFGKDLSRFNPPFSSLQKTVVKINQDDEARMLVANRLWVQTGYKLKDVFVNTLNDFYGADPVQLDFVKNAEDARKTINRWVEEKTENTILNLIPKGLLDAATTLVVTNAIYFRGQWDTRFDPKKTKKAKFHVAPGKSVDAHMMMKKEKAPYGVFKDFRVISMGYRNEQVSMYVILPKDPERFDEVEKSLDADVLRDVTVKLKRKDVMIRMPRFNAEYSCRLKPVLQKMGMKQAFIPGSANLSKISGASDLFISAVIHKAFVSVDEKGAEASAATAVVVTRNGGPVMFNANRPFIYLIRDDVTGQILFMGRVTDPS